MEKNVWVYNNNKNELLDMQHLINIKGSLRAFCMLKKEVLENAIAKCHSSFEAYNRPSFILLDYDAAKNDDFFVLEIIQKEAKLAGVPIAFLTNENNDDIDNACYEMGAVFTFRKPLDKKNVMSIERMSWQYEKTRNYEQILQTQNFTNRLMRKTFERYFSDNVVEEILDNPDGATIGGRKNNITVMMADLRGFTALSENVEADVITDIINHFLSVMTKVIFEFGGSVIEFIGDAILAVFGAPIETDNPNGHAIAAAINMQNSMKEVNEYNRTMGYPRIEMGIGLHRGETFIGNIGSERLMRYNIIGNTVNLCSRIESCSVGGQILTSESMILDIKKDLDILNVSEIYVKGISSKIRICDIAGIHGEFNYTLDKLPDEEFIPLKTEIPINIFPIKEKSVLIKPYKGILKGLSNKWALIEINQQVQLEKFADVELDVENKKDRPNLKNSYGKVMMVNNNQYMIRFTYNYVVNERAKMENKKETIYEVSDNLSLTIEEKTDHYNVICNSSDNKIRAIELLDFIFEQYGMVEGNKNRATGKVTKVVFDIYVSGLGFASVNQYLKNRLDKYFSEVDIVDSLNNKFDFEEFKRYRKKKIPWAYVKTTDIAKKGEILLVKSLENTSGIKITVSDDKYIMIGIRGEVYDIAREKFEKSYMETEEEFDVFDKILDFIPEVESYPEENGIAIDEYAKLCYPKSEAVIYAKEIKKRTKVFGKNNREDYFVGNPLDYLAVRIDDEQDSYIIKKDIFEDTYEEG